MGSTLLAVTIAIIVLFPDSPSRGFAALGVIFFMSNAALPSAGWIRFGDGCRWVVWQLGRRGLKPPPGGRSSSPSAPGPPPPSTRW